MDCIYINTTISVMKDKVCLFETDCEVKLDYSLPDGAKGPIDWDATEFHFDGPKPGAADPRERIYTAVTRTEPLFKLLYDSLDCEWLDERIREALADEGIVDLYPVPYHAL